MANFANGFVMITLLPIIRYAGHAGRDKRSRRKLLGPDIRYSYLGMATRNYAAILRGETSMSQISRSQILGAAVLALLPSGVAMAQTAASDPYVPCTFYPQAKTSSRCTGRR